MRRIIIPILVALAATLAGVAVAHSGDSSNGVKAVSATFAATTAARTETRACTGADGAYEIVKATYAGTAASTEPSLAGPVELKVTSVYNTTTKIGSLEGRLKIGEGDSRSSAKLWAVNSDGALDGFVYGETGHRGSALLGSLTAGWTRSGGFTDGKLGTGSSTNAAVLAGKPCTGKPVGSSVRLTVKGTVDAVSDTSISVKPRDGSAVQTCAIGATSERPSVVKGDSVEMTCAQIESAWVLVKAKKLGEDHSKKRGDDH